MQIKVLAVFSWMLLLCSCGQYIEENTIFKYPVTTVKIPEITGELKPELYSELDYPCAPFSIISDTIMFAYKPISSSKDDCFFSLVNLNTADTLARVGKRGRGANEMLMPSPFVGIDGEYAYIGENRNPKCYKLNITESIRRKVTVIDDCLELEHYTTFSPFHLSVYQDKLVCFNSMVNSHLNLDGSPFFMVFDLSDGRCIDEFHCFGNIPYDQNPGMIGLVQETLNCSLTMNKQTGQLFFANLLAPQINFLDVNTGDVRGIRFGKKMKLSLTNPYDCFISACSDESRIYAIFDGSESNLLYPSRDGVKLFVFDWDGNVLGQFQLDGYYLSCQIAGDRLLMTDLNKENKLFSISLEEIVSACN